MTGLGRMQDQSAAGAVPLRDLAAVFGRIGLLSFGGPAAQIALMHRDLVEARPWLTEAQFLRALSFCMLLPGPEAMQLATYAGWRLRGVPGGLIAGGLFVMPGALVIAAIICGDFVAIVLKHDRDGGADATRAAGHHCDAIGHDGFPLLVMVSKMRLS